MLLASDGLYSDAVQKITHKTYTKMSLNYLRGKKFILKITKFYERIFFNKITYSGNYKQIMKKSVVRHIILFNTL